MRHVTVQSLDGFRKAARALIHAQIAPTQVVLTEEPTLFDEPASAQDAGSPLRVPPRFFVLAQDVACHRAAERWTLLYRLLWRLQQQPHLMEHEADPDVASLTRMAQAVHRDIHKTHAFVRFRRVVQDGQEHFIAWHSPDHRILRRAVPHFEKRFAAMQWSILTPDECAHWDTRELHFSEGVPRSAAPDEDALEALWSAYYASVFNPARLNMRAMRAELPERFWSNLPELQQLSGLVAQAPSRTHRFTSNAGPASAAEVFLPQERSLPSLRASAARCTACPLHERATQTVFGQGAADARLMLVGEQPGDMEDRSGTPFVGPAGQLLSDTLEKVGIRREELYVTNAVKHFKFEWEEKRRIHQKPGRSEMLACNAWLKAEIDSVKPAMILALGATAAQSLMGARFSITRSRGAVFQTPYAPWFMATFHPAALLRAEDPTEWAAAFESDLATAAKQLRSPVPI